MINSHQTARVGLFFLLGLALTWVTFQTLSDGTVFRDKGYTLIDVRSISECGCGMIPGAINIPVDEIRERQSEITNKNLLVNCQVGQRGHTAAMLLKELGFNPVNLDGGYLTWSNSPAANRTLIPN